MLGLAAQPTNRVVTALALPMPASISAAIEIVSPDADGKTDPAGGMIATACCLGDVERAALVIAADVVAGNHAHADVAVNLRLAVIGVVACGLV